MRFDVLLERLNLNFSCFPPVKYIASIVTTLMSLKEEPKCNVSCCLEVLQIAINAQGEMTDVCNEPTITENPVFEDTVEDVTAYDKEQQREEEEEIEEGKENSKRMNKLN